MSVPLYTAMVPKNPVSRRTFIEIAAALGSTSLFANKGLAGEQEPAGREYDYESMAKLASNENPYGPSRSVLKAMQDAMKYAHRYGYPDPGILEAIADSHGVAPENILLGAGSTEILKVCDDVFLAQHKTLVGVDLTYESVYRFATNSKADAIKVPITDDYRTDIPGIIRAVKNNYRDVGLVYICNPNNPTGRIVPKNEIKQLIDNVPEDVPVLIDEAYCHYVDHPDYEEAIPYVRDQRNVIVTRTFSKMAGLAGMRLGYAVAREEWIQRMTPFASGISTIGGVNVLVRYAAVAALKELDKAPAMQKRSTDLRKKTVAELEAWGYEVMPSDANYFMVEIGEDVDLMSFEFEKRGVLVGRKFPPYDSWLRVSIGTADEMTRFVKAFKDILPRVKG
jgi:histidinol-phosphate aminotransferase